MSTYSWQPNTRRSSHETLFPPLSPTLEPYSAAHRSIFQYFDDLHRPRPNHPSRPRSFSTSSTQRPPRRLRLAPDIDVRETAEAYYFDIELPGVRDQTLVKIEWTSSRTFIVEGEIERPELGSDGWERPEGEEKSEPLGTDADGSSSSETTKSEKQNQPKEQGNPEDHDPRKETKKDMPNVKKPQLSSRLLLGERKIGVYHRTLSFPIDVDSTRLKAELEAGLLRIVVPKRKQEDDVGGGEAVE
ncbi:MAG: hypothetical protein M1834_000708 [Cirrosporium novae-zelandiae]|nr:MAG: hypothetical protein M1834_000708 [Cirrosporium novae-zelandiae]